jgi:hypothetical protein
MVCERNQVHHEVDASQYAVVNHRFVGARQAGSGVNWDMMGCGMVGVQMVVI